ncbi:vegetative cell wall protein gp1-like [Stylophora pistillata]|nr:vegetative cell wall protein gp1-like [Stylophora pistillata]
MNRQPQGVVLYQRPAQHCSSQGCTKCLLIFFTVICLLVGFILTMVGHLAKPFWGPEDDWCDFCREDRLEPERNLKNCRIVGPAFLAIGGVLLVISICYCQVQNKGNQGQVITGPPSTQTLSTSQAGPGAVTTSQYPPGNTFGPQQPYGQAYGYQPGPYPNNPQPPAAGPYPQYPTGQAYPPQTQHPYPPQSGQGYSPYPTTDMPPPPSYESATNQSATPSAPPMEKVV